MRVEKRGGETKILKREQAGSRDECLKKGGAGTPLQTIPLVAGNVHLCLFRLSYFSDT